MALTQVLYSLDTKQLLTDANLINEQELEDVLNNDIELLDSNWLVIGRQVVTKNGKKLDLLCVEQDGDLIVVELKKNLTPRDVTAQAIEYASYVSEMTTAEISDTYDKYAEKWLHTTDSLDAAYYRKFGTKLEADQLNQKVKMVIVAAKMDDGTEHIIKYLRNIYNVDINILFFRVFQNEQGRFLSRVWFEEDLDLIEPQNTNTKWNGEYYISFGTGKNETRKWEDAVKYGFISAGGGTWYTKTLEMLHPGDRIWVNIPHNGYVGVGIVKGDAVQACNAMFNQMSLKSLQQNGELTGEYLYSSDDAENAEYIVPVQWIKTIPENEAIKELGFFGNQNTVCRPTADRWQSTVNRLKKLWNIE